jgi:hypothetical protein
MAMTRRSELKVGQPVVYRGATATIAEVGPYDEGHRWLVIATHEGTKRIPDDHPALFIPRSAT